MIFEKKFQDVTYLDLAIQNIIGVHGGCGDVTLPQNSSQI